MKSFVLFWHQSMGTNKPIFVRYIFAVLRIRIRGPGSGAFFGPGIQDPGWVKYQDPDPG
jgi:hypothetical protein